jgi:tetratricopeptide (TPR) repeat protein
MDDMIARAESFRVVWGHGHAASEFCEHDRIEKGRSYLDRCFVAARERSEKRFVTSCLSAMSTCAIQSGRPDGLMEAVDEWLPYLETDETTVKSVLGEILLRLDIMDAIEPYAHRAVDLAEGFDLFNVSPARRVMWLHRAGDFEAAWSLAASYNDESRRRMRWPKMVRFFVHALDLEHAEKALERLDDQATHGVPERAVWTIRLHLLRGDAKQAFDVAKKQLSEEPDTYAFSGLARLFERQGYPELVAQLIREFEFEENVAQMHRNARWSLGVASDAGREWLELRESLAQVTSDTCTEPEDRGRKSALCRGLDPYQVYRFRDELSDRGMLEEAVEYTNWMFWVHEPGHHGGRQVHTVGEAHRIDLMLLRHGLFDAYDELQDATSRRRQRWKVAKQNLLRALVRGDEPEAIERAFVDATLSSGGSVREELFLIMEVWGHTEIMDRALAGDEIAREAPALVSELKLRRLLHADRFDEAIAHSSQIAHRLGSVSGENARFERHRLASQLKRHLVEAASLESPVFALELLEELDIALPRELRVTRTRLELLADQPPSADSSLLYERKVQRWEHRLHTLYCQWPWSPDGIYEGVPDLEGQTLDQGVSCPIIDNPLPSDPREAHAEPAFLRHPIREHEVRRGALERRQRRRLDLSVKMASLPLAKIAAVRTRARGEAGWIGPEGHPDIVEAVNAPVVEAAPGHRQAALNIVLAELNRRPSKQAREALLDELEAAEWAPGRVWDVVEHLRRLELWVEIARVIRPRLELADQERRTLRALLEADARIGRVEQAIEAADAYAERAPDTFRAYMRAARMLEERGASEGAIALAEKASTFEPEAPGPRAIVARHSEGSFPDDWVLTSEARRRQLRAAIARGADREEIFDFAEALIRPYFVTVDREGGIYETIDVFEDAGAAELGVEFFETRLPRFVRAASFESRWAEHLAELYVAAGDHEAATRVYRQMLTVDAVRHRVDWRDMMNMSWLTLARGEAEQSLKWARLATHHGRFTRNGSPRLFHTLARAQAAAGCPLAASHSFERALVERGASYERLTSEQRAEAMHHLARHPADISLTEQPICHSNGSP